LKLAAGGVAGDEPSLHRLRAGAAISEPRTPPLDRLDVGKAARFAAQHYYCPRMLQHPQRATRLKAGTVPAARDLFEESSTADACRLAA